MGEYKYQGIKLKAGIFKELLIEFYDGMQFERSEAIERIMKYHSENGGITCGVNGVSVFKSASKMLKGSGIERIAYGTWTLKYEKTEIVRPDPVDGEQSIAIVAKKEIGYGNNAVYIYYFETYKVLAQMQGKEIWQCKIGRTDKGMSLRISNQVGTCFPELPKVALIINCEDSIQVENAIHSFLKSRKRWIENAPGKEWFITNPEEVETIYRLLIGDLLPTLTS